MYKIKVNGKYEYAVVRTDPGLMINDEIIQADIRHLNPSAFHVIERLKSYNVEVTSFDPIEKTAGIKVNNTIYSISVKDKFDVLLDQLGLGSLNSVKIAELRAPMPGLVLKVLVKEGDEVKKGENLFILEAMKMENIIKAPADVVIKSVKLKHGDKVEKGQILLVFA